MSTYKTHNTQRIGRRGSKTPPQQIRDIQRWQREGYSAQEITRLLDEKYPNNAAQIRTVQKTVRDIKENRIPWNRLATNSVDTTLVFKVLAEVIKKTQGRKLTFTQDEVEWVDWVSKATPGLPQYSAWSLAVAYLHEERRDQPNMARLDAYIAFKSWESPEAEREYFDAVPEGERYIPNVEGTTSVSTTPVVQTSGTKGPARS
jgi:hypothetical protein